MPYGLGPVVELVEVWNGSFEHVWSSARWIGVRRWEGDLFSPENVRNGTTMAVVSEFIEYRRHSKSLANYLYYDGHVQSIPAEAIEEWIQRGWNFLDVGKGAYND